MGEITYSSALKPQWVAGLLGATVDENASASTITNARLVEIERRILDIEAKLRTLEFPLD